MQVLVPFLQPDYTMIYRPAADVFEGPGELAKPSTLYKDRIPKLPITANCIRVALHLKGNGNAEKLPTNERLQSFFEERIISNLI